MTLFTFLLIFFFFFFFNDTATTEIYTLSLHDALPICSCAIVCTDNADCPSTCGGCSNPDVEGAHHCIGDFVRPQVFCTSTTDCPPGSHCQNIGAASSVCISVCR